MPDIFIFFMLLSQNFKNLNNLHKIIFANIGSEGPKNILLKFVWHLLEASILQPT